MDTITKIEDLLTDIKHTETAYERRKLWDKIQDLVYDAIYDLENE